MTDLHGVRILDLDRERRRVRFRVFVVYYDPSRGTGDLLPRDPTFFFRVLWEGGLHKVPGFPLTDLVEMREFLDEGWVDRHTHRFVAGVECVATRNHPIDDDAWDDLAMFSPQHDGRWGDEELLAQGDYDVEVTDSRWLDHLRIGRSWGTASYDTRAWSGRRLRGVDAEAEYTALAAKGDAGAEFVLGWLRKDRGDALGATAAYLRATETVERELRLKALLYLGDLYVEQGAAAAARAAYADAVDTRDSPYVSARSRGYMSLASSRLGTLLRASGDDEAASDAQMIAELLSGDMPQER